MLDELRRHFRRRPASVAPVAPAALPVIPDNPIPAEVDPSMVGFVDAVRSGWYRQETDTLLQGFPIHGRDIVVDLGCGGGIATIFAAQRGASVIFADIDAAAVNALTEKIKDSPARSWRGIVTDANPLPVEDAVATRIVAMEVLEHVSDPVQVMRELVRVAAPGALFLLAVPDAESEALQRTVAPPEYFAPPNHVRIFSQLDFERLVTDAGLTIERRHAYSCFWNIGMALFWLSSKASGEKLAGPALNALKPHYPPLVEHWARLWQQILDLPEGASLLAELDRVLPKSRILVARKA